MRIKKYQAKNFRQALSLVKKDLGANAVILSSEEIKSARPYVEITAAVEYDGDMNAQTEYTVTPAVSGPAGYDEFRSLKNEVMNLRDYIETMRNVGYELNLPEERKRMFYFLRDRSIKEDLALRLVEKVSRTDDLERIMSEEIRSLTPSVTMDAVDYKRSGPGDQKVLMLIGPTGVGKTTTVAKLASQAIREGKKVAFISLDTYKIGAAEQIRIYSRMIGIPLDIVSDTESLRKSIGRFTDRDVLLVDTTGQNPKDSDYINRLRGICETGMPMETQLLLSTSSDNGFLMETHKHYNSLPIDSMAFTKTDEAVRLGSVYNLCRLYQKPVAYITTGQSVPGNIEFVDSKKLTNLILRTGSA
jgi:flagellar biosynthesis protein FlhF